jgi:toxin ParE1/3/4
VSRYRLTPRARKGLEEILTYVADEFGARVAEAVLERHVAAFERLAESPGIGHVREDITKDAAVRFWPVGPSLVAYRGGPDGVEILFVERGERDWGRILS